jgi:hypothetical protein
VAAFIRALQRGLYTTLSAACDTTLKSTSGIKGAMKLVLVAARTTKRLATRYGSVGDIWEPTLWTELHKRLVAHDRFKASVALVGMCKQVVQLVQLQRALPSAVAGECANRCDQVNKEITGSKRKASIPPDVGNGGKKAKRLPTATRGGKKARDQSM